MSQLTAYYRSFGTPPRKEDGFKGPDDGEECPYGEEGQERAKPVDEGSNQFVSNSPFAKS